MNSQMGEMYEAPSLYVRRAAWSRVIGLLDLARRELEHHSKNAHATIVLATSLLQEQIGSHPSYVNAKTNEGLPQWQVRKLLEFIDGRMAARVTVSDLCAVVQLSQGHFARRFRQAFGESPHRYLMHRRLDGAMRLMLASSVPMSEVALRCGFADQAHLCKRFRQVIGESPAAWRRARRTAPSQRRLERSSTLAPAETAAPRPTLISTDSRAAVASSQNGHGKNVKFGIGLA